MDLPKLSADLPFLPIGKPDYMGVSQKFLLKNPEVTMTDRPKMLLEVVQETLRRKHYSFRTEKTYLQWIKRYLLFHNKRHPREMGKAEIEAFLTHLAVQEHVAAATQNQALNAILFLYTTGCATQGAQPHINLSCLL